MGRTGGKGAAEELRQRLACERAVTKCISILSETGDLDERFARVLDVLRAVSGVGRVYIFRNEHDPEAGLCMTQTHESCGEGVEPQNDNPLLQHLPYREGGPNWLRLLRERRPVSGPVADMADPERGVLESQGILSVLVVPIFSGGDFRGFVGFDDCAAPRPWRSDDIEMLTAVADAIGTAALRGHMQQELRRRVELERLAATVTSRLACVTSGQLDEAVDHALASVGSFAGADRAYVFIFQPCGTRVDNTHEWCAEGVEPQMAGLRDIHLEDELPWFARRILGGEVFNVPDVAALPPGAKSEREHFQDQGIQSAIVVPMLAAGQRVGFLGFDAVRARRSWCEDDEAVLALVGEALANVLVRVRAERDLAERERYLRTILQTTADGFWVVSGEGRLVDVNDAYCAMSGYTREELLGMHVNDIDAVETPAETRRRMARVIQTGAELFETRHRGKDGTLFDVEVSVTCMHDGEVRLVCFCRDITGRKAVGNRLRLQSLVLDQIQDRVTVTDLDGVITYVNEAEVRTLGYSRDALTGKPTAVYGEDPEQGATQRAILEETLRNGRWRGQVVNKASDGRAIIFDCRTQVVRDETGEAIALCGIATDITERKRAEDALRESEEGIRRKLDALLLPEGDIGDLELADVVDIPAIQTLMDDFHSVTNVGVAVVDMSGKVLVATGWQDICTRFHRVHPEACRNCIESDSLLSAGVEPGEFKTYRCKNNMWDIATPIVIGGKHVGNVFLGQFFFDDEEPDIGLFRAQARKYGFNEEEYLDALTRVPRWSRDKVRSVMSFYARFASLVSKLSFSNLKLARTVEELERADSTLRESLEKYRTLVEGIPDVVVRFDRHLVHRYVSSSIENITGVPAGECVGKTQRELGYSEKVCDLCGNAVQRVFDSGQPFETEFAFEVNQNGFVFNLRCLPERDAEGDVVTVLAIARDVTAHRKAEQEYEVLFREMLEGFAVHEIVCDDDGRPVDYRFLAVNPAFERLTGLRSEAVVGRTVLELLPDTERYWIETYGRVALTGKPAVFENYSRTLDKHFQVTAFRSAPGQFACIFTDVTGQKRAEMKLAASEAKYRSIVDQCVEMLYVHDLTGRIREVNKAAVRGTGYSRRELLRMSVFDLHADVSGREAIVAQWEQWDPGQQVVIETEHRRKDGTLVPVEAVTGKVWFQDDEYILALVQDITERKRAEQERLDLERQVQHAQKLESLGVLAGGIAHDFNNLLMAILGHADLALDELSPTAPARGNIEQVETAARRAADLCRQMLAYSGKGHFVIEPFRFGALIEEMAHLLRTSISKKALLNLDLEKGIPPVEGDVTQVRQVIMNLVINASEAIGERSGVITIRTGAAHCTAADLDSPASEGDLPGGLYAWVEVADTGCGMDAETLERLFDPFFTTKFTGRGLGMSAVLGIVRGHKGALKVESEPGKGTVFRVALPASPEPAETAGDGEGQAPIMKGKGGTVLLVDDEQTIRALGRRMLERIGLTVLTAADGKEALRVFSENADAIDLVLLDLTMPRMDGEEAYRELRKLDPNVRVVMSSGYSEHEIETRFAGAGLAGFVQKPYTLAVLKDRLYPLVDGRKT